MDEKEVDEMIAKSFQESLELWKKALPTAASYDPDELLKPTEKELRECGLWISPEKGEYLSKATKRNQVSNENRQQGRVFDQEIWSDDEDADIVGGETHSKLTQPEKSSQVSADSNVLRVDSSTKQVSIDEQVEGSQAKTSSKYTFRKRRPGSNAYWKYFSRAKKPVKGMNELLPSASIGLDTGEEIFKHLKEFKEQAKQRHKVETRAIKKAPKKARTKKLGPLKQTSTKAAQKKLGRPRKKAATKKDQGSQVSADNNVLKVDSSTKQVSIDEHVEGSEAETNSKYTFRKRHTGRTAYWDYPFCANKPVRRSRSQIRNKPG